MVRSSLELNVEATQAGAMADMGEEAVAAEAAAEATTAVVGAAVEDTARIMIATSKVSTRPQQVTEIRHPHRTREGTSLRRLPHVPILRRVLLETKVDRMGTDSGRTVLN